MSESHVINKIQHFIFPCGFFFTRSSCLWINEVGKRFALQSDISVCECIKWSHRLTHSVYGSGVAGVDGGFCKLLHMFILVIPAHSQFIGQRLIRFKKLRLELLLLLHIVNVKQINFFNMIWNFKWHMRVRAGTINTKLYCASQSCCSSISTNISIPFNNNRQII